MSLQKDAGKVDWYSFVGAQMSNQSNKQQFIDKYFNGDEKLFAETILTKKSAEEEEASDFMHRSVLRWDDIATTAKCAPQYEEMSLKFIKEWLGYMPPLHAYIPHLAFIQSLFENYQGKLITGDYFVEEIAFHMKRIRNSDMKGSGWVRFTTYRQPDYDDYNSHLTLYRQPARERLSTFLGYEPSIEYSLDAEIMLRGLFELEIFYSEMPYCHLDYKAATIARYRQAYLTQGETRADASELSGVYRGVEFIT